MHDTVDLDKVASVESPGRNGQTDVALGLQTIF